VILPKPAKNSFDLESYEINNQYQKSLFGGKPFSVNKERLSWAFFLHFQGLI